MKKTAKTPRRAARRAQAMIGILVALAIGMLLYVFLLGPSVREKNGNTVSTQKAAIDKADDTVTDINISQLRTLINEYKNDNDGRPPASFDEVKRISKMPDTYFVDPVTKHQLFYDPATGFIGRDTDPRPAAPAVVATPGAPATQPAAQPAAPPSVPSMPGAPNIKIPQPAAPPDTGE